jgi:hypothetical protein
MPVGRKFQMPGQSVVTTTDVALKAIAARTIQSQVVSASPFSTHVAIWVDLTQLYTIISDSDRVIISDWRLIQFGSAFPFHFVYLLYHRCLYPSPKD